jgi:hypothetical protein
MQVASVNLGLPRLRALERTRADDGDLQNPVEGRIPLHRLNREGDRQADLSAAVACPPADRCA